VRLETGAASRTLQAASCEELANATAVFLAILLEPDAEQPEAEPAAPPKAAPAAPAEPATVPPAPPPPARSRHFALGATLGARSGLVPDYALGVGLHATFSWQALRTSAGVGFWFPDTTTVAGTEAQGAKLQASSAFAELCWQLESPVLIPALCSGGELSLLRGEGFGPGVAAESRTAALGALSAGGALRLRQSERVSWLLDADAVFPLSRPKFVFAGSAPALLHTPSAGFRLTIGAQWSL
jgi:hypothetical protein